MLDRQVRIDRHFRRIDLRAVREAGWAVADRLAWLERRYDAHQRTAPMRTLLIETQVIRKYREALLSETAAP